MSKATAASKHALSSVPPNDAPLIAWAMWHHDHGEAIHGYWLTPIRPGQKAAYQANWSKEPLKTRAAVERHWQDHPNDNIGLVPRPGCFWLDADDLDVLEKAEATHGQLPRVYKQRSLNGSLHFLFQGDVNNSPTVYFDGKKLGEIRGALSGQCVGAGSRGTTKEGKAGTWKIEEHALPMLAPGWVFSMIKRDGKATLKDGRKDYGEITDWDVEQAKYLLELVERGKRIKDYEGVFFEGERDNLTYQLFAEAKNRMIHPDAMLDTVISSGIAGDFDDVERKMQSAYQDGNTQDGYGSKVNAYWLPNYLFKAYVGGKPVDRAPADPVEWKAANVIKLPKTFPGDPAPAPEFPMGSTQSFYYLGALDTIPEPTWVIEGVLSESSYSLIYGKRSTKKSFAALDVGLSLATGTPYHGHEVKRGRVVYFAGEGFRGNRRRVEAWFKTRKLNREDFAKDFALVPFTPKWDTSRGCDLVRQVLSAITKDGAISLVIIDTARRAMSGDENAPTSVGQFLDGVSDVCREFGCGYIIVHHAGKDESKGARGGGPFEDDADTVLRFTKGPGGAVHMTCTKQKDAEADWMMKFRTDPITLGSEPNGKPITSLVLALESESKAEDDESSPAPSEREQYAVHDAVAAQILDRLEDPNARRGELAQAVMGEMLPEMAGTDPNAFKKALRAYGAHLTRLNSMSTLWRYISEKNAKGEALIFRNPQHTGRRAPKPGRRRGTLSYAPIKREAEDA